MRLNSTLGDSHTTMSSKRKGHDLEVLGKVPAGRTATRVRFWPDTEIFDADAAIEYPAVRDRVAQTAAMVFMWRSWLGCRVQ